jgi:Transposase
VPTAIGSPAAPFTTWATLSPVGPATSSYSARSTTAAIAASTSTPTPPTWLTPAAITRAGSSTLPFGWSSRTACPIAQPNGPSGAITACSSLTPRSRTGSRPGGKKAARRIDKEHLDWALSDFSGFIAVDELYDGPFCILSIVDNRTFKRLTYQVLDHDPTHTDITAFFRRFHRALTARGLTLQGITTDGSALYPEPIAEVFGEVPHQLCTFHILREVTKAILSAVAKERKRLAATAPKLPRGRPRATKAARRAARRKKQIERKVGDLFDHRYLFVQRHLSPSERVTLQRISRGRPQLRQLRELMEEVYRLFDRRCRMATALAKLAVLRARLRRFKKLRSVLKKLLSPSLEKALVFLDERLMGATSNAVERGNRRYRKMQKTVYRVRTQKAIEGRLALDLLRESQAGGRAGTTKILHRVRAA